MYEKHVNALLTPEDREALADLRRRQIEARRPPTGLRPWMRMFAVDYALKSNGWSRDELLETARQYANFNISKVKLNQILRREDFKALVEMFVEDRAAAARQQLEGMLPKTLAYVEESIDNARAAADYKAMPTVVEPVLGRVVPKKEEREQTPPQVIVNLGGKFAQMLLDSEPQEVEVEELPVPQEPDDGK